MKHLKHLSGLLLKHFRGEDIPCRYGGDEFIIVMPDASREVTLRRARQLCEDAHNLHILFDGQILEAFTISIGVAVFPGDSSTSAGVLKAVDDALYCAKREGRGQVVAAN